MHPKRLLGVAAACALALAATASAATPPSCTPGNYYMQCAANAPGQTPPTQLGATAGTFGVDSYGAANPGIAATFDCTYLSGSPGGKDWTASGRAAWVARGKKTCVVWETYANRAEFGYGAGQDDARAARAEAAAVGFPTYVPIRFAVDTDTSAANVAAYFEGVKSILGDRTGAYGSYTIVTGLEARGITTPRNDWQTIAWSYGNRSRACLYQSSINDTLDGESVDYDTASCADFGQDPYAQTPKTVCFGKHAQGSKACQAIHADVRKWQAAVKSSNGAYDARGCVALTKTRNTLNARWDWFWTQLREHPKVKTAYRKAALASTGRAVNSVRRVITGRACLTFSGRVSYFTALIQATERKYT
jgi:hypothetical protein